MNNNYIFAFVVLTLFLALISLVLTRRELENKQDESEQLEQMFLETISELTKMLKG